MAAADGVSVASLPAGFDRWDELLGVIRASFAYMDGVIDPPSSAHRLTAEALRAKAAEEVCFLAVAGTSTAHEVAPKPSGDNPATVREIVGCAFLAERPDHFYLGKLAVLPERQGRGLGRALLRAAEAHACSAGKPVIELQTRVELTANHRAFAALGFVETGRTAHPGFVRPTSVTMRKALA
jgi:ribosomal protein S18 acetylase RimI-like enzyme